jgi:hypothetical protein
VQRDIEQLARCFTGWTVCKVPPEAAQPFPLSATNPPAACGVQYTDAVFLNLGSGWKYFKGTVEPTPAGDGSPTMAWTQAAFNDAAWLSGSTGIGYGDNDDATTLTDMLGGYRTVYLRRKFNVTDPSAFENLILEIAYDDGYVAYLNGVEVGRSENMEDYGNPPAFNQGTGGAGHEVNEGIDTINLNRFLGLLQPGPNNVLAIQVHNVNLDSSDLSMRPRLLDRTILGGMENGDPNGIWTFRFDPALHDATVKTIYQGTPYQINVPARAGMAGLQDAIEVIRAMVNDPTPPQVPSTAEFICIKLIQRFVSDNISLATYKAGTAPADLVALLGSAIAAWNSTTPKGNIRTVMEAILDPVDRQSEFWSATHYRAKVKTPIEYINSTLRVLEGVASGAQLPELNGEMGMFLFTRDEPDGWSELGVDWIDTASLRERIDFAQAFAENRQATSANFRWNTLPFLDARGLDTADEIVDYFNELLFQGTLSPTDRARLLEFLTTDNNYNPLALNRANANFQTRVQEFLGLMLSLPQWHFQ